jgi:ribosome biogenesis GTPase A
MILYNEYDSYFTERGHKIIDEMDPLSEKPKTGIYLPIILVGSPGCGKSTFINVVNERRISRASSSQLPVTSQSAVYDVKIPGNANKENQINDLYLEQEAYVRFIDTPGFDLEKDIDIAKKEIEKIYKIIRYKTIIFLVSEIILMFFFYYFVTAFCEIYNQTQLSWLYDFLDTVVISLFGEFVLSLVLSALYIVSIKHKVELFYKVVLFVYNM